jgi:hypothetical protein
MYAKAMVVVEVQERQTDSESDVFVFPRCSLLMHQIDGYSARETGSLLFVSSKQPVRVSHYRFICSSKQPVRVSSASPDAGLFVSSTMNNEVKTNTSDSESVYLS